MNMHRKTRLLRIAFAAALATTLGSLTASPVMAVSTNPNPVCSNGSCTITFDYSGDYFQFAPPAAVRTLYFEAYGAQGGRGGGNGAKIAGFITPIPANLLIYVGGAGQTGSSKAGGFNGGGTSGAGHSDEGSGGGASDIRLTTALTDRIVVAGGGGGTGGWVGGSGGLGGGTIAGAGQAGQAGGGAGGTQLAGGAGGAGNSGNAGTAGTLANGGAGGNGAMGGGGGGGGGYYGGGGGGGDGIPSGMDGGGGGGGSNYASIAYTSSVSHAAGVRTGNGQVILTYTYAPTVTTFAPTASVSNSSTATFNLTFSQSVLGLDSTDFSFTGTASGCFVSSVSGSGSSYTVVASGCSDGTVMLNLAVDAVTGATTGPMAIATSSSITLDRAKPVITVTAPNSPINATTLTYSITSDENITGLAASSFTIAGTSCVIGTLTGTGKAFSLNVDSCSSTASAVLTLKANVATDAAGNTGPNSAVTANTVQVDRVVPAVTSLTKNVASRTGMQVYDLVMSENVTGITSDSSDWTIAGAGCAITKLTGSGTTYSVWVTGCNDGVRTSITLKANSLADSAGNLGPAADAMSPETQIDDLLPRASIVADARATQSSSPSFTITFSEPVSGATLDVFTRSGTAKRCVFALSEVTANLVYRLSSTLCGAGTVRVGLPANAIQDANGNLGPSVALESPQVTIDVDVASGVTAGVKRIDRTAPSSVKFGLGSNRMQAAGYSSSKRFTLPGGVTITDDVHRWLIAGALPLVALLLLHKRRVS